MCRKVAESQWRCQDFFSGGTKSLPPSPLSSPPSLPFSSPLSLPHSTLPPPLEVGPFKSLPLLSHYLPSSPSLPGGPQPSNTAMGSGGALKLS